MQLPNIVKFVTIQFCALHREDCEKIDKTKISCKGNCTGCEYSEEVIDVRSV
jgi:molybdenum cofactor biosynthesis enzyme MoaA